MHAFIRKKLTREGGVHDREGGAENLREPQGRAEWFGTHHLALMPPFTLVPKDSLTDTFILSMDKQAPH